MRTVLILPDNRNGKAFKAYSGKKHSSGETVGKAVDALTEQLENSEGETLFIVQRWSPDEFFTTEQQKRLAELTQKVHAAPDSNQAISAEEKTELEKLIEAELEGSGRRAEKLAQIMK